jgi:hypothetical protein
LISAGGATAARAADAVTFWNEVANTMTSPRGPASMLDMAKMHIAMHDAVQSFEFRFEPYCGTVPNAAGSPCAAVAKAARDVLVGLLPLTAPQLAALDATCNKFLSGNGLVGNAGVTTGQQAASVSRLGVRPCAAAARGQPSLRGPITGGTERRRAAESVVASCRPEPPL